MSTPEAPQNQANQELSDAALDQVSGGLTGLDIDKAVDPSRERVVVITQPSGSQVMLQLPRPSHPHPPK